MNRELAEAMRLDAQDALTMRELVELSGLAESVLRELVDYGALQPVDVDAPSWRFGAHCIVVARTACRLHRDLELEPHALSLVLRLIERIDALEAEVRAMHARMSR